VELSPSQEIGIDIMIALRLVPIVFAASLLLGPAAAGVPPPRVSGADVYDMAVPEAPFSDRSDAARDVDRAFAQARAEHKRVLIDLGANWCADCRVLAGILDLGEVRHFVDTYFVVVNVDVGHFDRNLDIPARFGIYDRLRGVPSILVASPDGVLLNTGRTEALVNAGHMDPQSVVNWLANWAK
jgi:thiol:disulfide interchange protein